MLLNRQTGNQKNANSPVDPTHRMDMLSTNEIDGSLFELSMSGKP
jgi:hypothetical protein